MLPTISAPVISARGISARTFHQWDICACACFGPADVPAHRHFVSMDFLAWGHFGARNFRYHGCFSMGHFGTWTFWDMHGYFGTLQSNMDILAQTFWHLCYYARMLMCRNVPVPKRPWCQKILVPKCPRAKKSSYQNVHLPKHLQGRNVHAPKCPSDEMSMAEMLNAEMVGSRAKALS